MTERPAHDATTAVNDAQRARVEELRRRRAEGAGSAGPARSAAAASGSRHRRRHPAAGARIGAAGFGVATMLGLVAVMGFARPVAESTAPLTATLGDPVGTLPATPTSVSTAAIGSPASTTTTPPISLAARPTVRVSPPSTAVPSARTHGSH